MKRFALLLSCALMAAGAGCCWHQPYNQCGYGYGAGYAPTYAPASPYGGGCPGGSCGPGYYSQGAYMSGATTAYSPYMGGTATAYGAPSTYYTTATLDPMPAH